MLHSLFRKLRSKRNKNNEEELSLTVEQANLIATLIIPPAPVNWRLKPNGEDEGESSMTESKLREKETSTNGEEGDVSPLNPFWIKRASTKKPIRHSTSTSLSSLLKKSPSYSVDGSDTDEIGRAVQQECRDRSRMPSSA
eukprot:TRINITY_DN61666_c0_g1_i3.p1 TRINITY_DN61666_c0_g1~~TRINITY_DN61666_c0_g1_i3.p1  ORF type:complete len:140 (+),score=15.32 TRINITY_DN61666_c0_g1_i3:123-542(+)